MADVLDAFANTVLKEKMESLGFKHKKNGWYKVIPDVILCVELQKLSFHAFRINYGIVPFSCYLFYNLELATYEIENANWDKNRDKYISQFNLPCGSDNRNHSWSPDSTAYSLKDPQKYPFYLTFWTDAVNETVIPALQQIHDLKSASDTIEQLWSKKTSLYEYYSYAPMFVKMGEYGKAMTCMAPYINEWSPGGNRDDSFTQMKATEAWNAWKTKGTHIRSPFLWQWLIQTNDYSKLDELIAANEAAALTWIKKNKFEHKGNIAGTVLAL